MEWNVLLGLAPKNNENFQESHHEIYDQSKIHRKCQNFPEAPSKENEAKEDKRNGGKIASQLSRN